MNRNELIELIKTNLPNTDMNELESIDTYTLHRLYMHTMNI